MAEQAQKASEIKEAVTDIADGHEIGIGIDGGRTHKDAEEEAQSRQGGDEGREELQRSYPQKKDRSKDEIGKMRKLDGRITGVGDGIVAVLDGLIDQ